MKRYSEYKDSGVKWIGEIPGHWEIRRLKNVVLCNAETLSENFPKDEVIKYVEISDVNYTSGITNIQRMPFGEAPSRARRITKKNDVIVSTVRTYLKAVAKIQEDGLIVSTGFAVLHPLIGNSSFLSYFALSESFIHNVIVNSKGISYPAITASDLICIAMPLPPLSEQEAIVTYLDTKVAKIDEYISIAEKKIAALEELKQSIIAEAVTRGIHKEVPMKDSGVKWIGMIPEHWKIMRLRFVCEFRNGYTPSKANPKFWENGTIPWFRMEDIRDSGRFLNEAKQYISKEAVKGDGLFEAGSFILATTATIGEHAMLIADSLANQRFTNLKIRKSLISKLSRNFFFYYLFVIDEYCKSTTRKATFPSVDMTDLKNIGVSIPPIEEQQEIVTYLDSKVANINQLCQAERSQIEKLKEYKQRLISDVVTGKVKVTND